MFVIIVVASLTFSTFFALFGSSSYDSEDENRINIISSTPTVSPEPKKVIPEVIVKPWDGVIDLVNGYGIEVEIVNSYGLLFRDDDVSFRINVMSEEWVIQYAYFFSDLVVDSERVLTIEKYIAKSFGER